MNETKPNANAPRSSQMIELDESSLANVNGGLEVCYTTLAAMRSAWSRPLPRGSAPSASPASQRVLLYRYFSREAY